MLIYTNVTNYPVTKAWEKGKFAVKENRLNDARNYIDIGITIVYTYSMEKNDCGDDLGIEGKTRRLWLTRFWKVGLENNNLLL